MKLPLSMLLAVLFLQGCDRQSNSGRFKIVAGTYDEVINATGVEVLRGNGNAANSKNEIHGIFKIDTQTGQAWIYLDVVNITTNGHSFENGWKELNDIPR